MLRRPWDVSVDEVTLSDGAWALVNDRPGRPITVAFRKVPPAGRSECRTPTQLPARSPRQGELLDARRVILRNTLRRPFVPRLGRDARFRRRAGQLEGTGGRGRPAVPLRRPRRQREARRVVAHWARRPTADARGAVRRRRNQTNRRHRRRRRTILFSTSAVRGPADATLSGRALFTDVFVPTPRRVPAGMKLDAEWRGIGQALVRESDLGTPGRAPRSARCRSARVVARTFRGPDRVRGAGRARRLPCRPACFLIGGTS